MSIVHIRHKKSSHLGAFIFIVVFYFKILIRDLEIINYGSHLLVRCSRVKLPFHGRSLSLADEAW